MSRRDFAGSHFGVIPRVNRVDEIPIPFARRIEIRPKSAVDEGIDHIPVRDEDFKVEMIEQERQNILRADTFKAVEEGCNDCFQ